MKIGEHEVVIVDKDTVKVGCQTVTRSELAKVLILMDEWKPAPQFQVGDFVRVRLKQTCSNTDNYIPRKVDNFIGSYGRVAAFDRGGRVGTEFAFFFLQGHDLDGATRHGHGYWLLPEMLEKVE